MERALPRRPSSGRHCRLEEEQKKRGAKEKSAEVADNTGESQGAGGKGLAREEKKPSKSREGAEDEMKAGGAKPGRIYLLGLAERNQGRKLLLKPYSTITGAVPSGQIRHCCLRRRGELTRYLFSRFEASFYGDFSDQSRQSHARTRLPMQSPHFPLQSPPSPEYSQKHPGESRQLPRAATLRSIFWPAQATTSCTVTSKIFLLASAISPSQAL